MASVNHHIPSQTAQSVEIVPWREEYVADFAEINRLWIEDLFEVEQHDIDQMLKVQTEKNSALNKFSLIL